MELLYPKVPRTSGNSSYIWEDPLISRKFRELSTKFRLFVKIFSSFYKLLWIYKSFLDNWKFQIHLRSTNNFSKVPRTFGKFQELFKRPIIFKTPRASEKFQDFLRDSEMFWRVSWIFGKVPWNFKKFRKLLESQLNFWKVSRTRGNPRTWKKLRQLHKSFINRAELWKPR